VLASGSEDGTARVWLRPLDFDTPPATSPAATTAGVGGGGDGGDGGDSGKSAARPAATVLQHQGIVTGVER
jgi:hypothetical protein